LSNHKYSHGIFKFGTLGLGLTAELMGWLTPNVNYGMMTAASYLIGARIPAVFHDKTLKDIATHVAPSFYERPQQPPTAAGLAAAPSFFERPQQPPTAAGMSEAAQVHTHTTVQGSVAPGCSACGSRVAASAAIPGRRTDIPSRSPITSAGYVGQGTDYRVINSKPTGAG